MSGELEEIDELMNYVAEQSQVLRSLDRELDPFWRRQSELATALIKTHPWIAGDEAVRLGLGAEEDQVYVTGYGRADRTGLFAELDRLTDVFGPIRTRRREVKAEVDAALRAAERLRELLDKPPRPRREPMPRSVSRCP